MDLVLKAQLNRIWNQIGFDKKLRQQSIRPYNPIAGLKDLINFKRYRKSGRYRTRMKLNYDPKLEKRRKDFENWCKPGYDTDLHPPFYKFIKLFQRSRL